MRIEAIKTSASFCVGGGENTNSPALEEPGPQNCCGWS